MPTIVISQPFLFPWVGLFEQIKLADVFVHYDDVAFSKGSFVNRVQVKSDRGPRWITVPLAGKKLGDKIVDLKPDDSQPWRRQHLECLQLYYETAPHCDEMLQLVQDVYATRCNGLADLLIDALQRVVAYFDLSQTTRFFRSSQLAVSGRSSERVLALVRHFGGNRYVTGHGAKNYLDHEAFEAEGVSVRYMDYQRLPYPQSHGAFDPHVTILDLIANCGRAGRQYLCSSTLPWREFLNKQGVGRTPVSPGDGWMVA